MQRMENRKIILEPIARHAHLVLTPGAFLLLLDEVGCRCWRGRSPHAANDSNAVLRERGETQLLALTDLYVLKLLKAAKCELKEKMYYLNKEQKNYPK